MMEALQLWKKVSGKGENNASEELVGIKSYSHYLFICFEFPDYVFPIPLHVFVLTLYSIDGKVAQSGNGDESDDKQSNFNCKRSESLKDSSLDCLSTGSKLLSKGKDSNILETAAVILRKKVPSLKDQELNPEFFQKLETRSSNDVPVEVVLPRRCLESSHTVGKEEQGSPDDDSRILSNLENQGRIDLNYRNTEKRKDTNNNPQDLDYFTRDKWTERGFRSRDLKMRAFDADERDELSQKDSLPQHAINSRTDGLAESLGMNNKGNWLVIQRQLSQLERQQAHLMNMLQVCFKNLFIFHWFLCTAI